MQYQCGNCQKTFVHYATLTKQKHLKIADQEFLDGVTLELKVCPFCEDEKISEFIDPIVANVKVTNVLVVDLVVGENLALNKALSEGYEIVGRYAKQYTLEKREAV